MSVSEDLLTGWMMDVLLWFPQVSLGSVPARLPTLQAYCQRLPARKLRSLPYCIHRPDRWEIWATESNLAYHIHQSDRLELWALQSYQASLLHRQVELWEGYTHAHVGLLNLSKHSKINLKVSFKMWPSFTHSLQTCDIVSSVEYKEDILKNFSRFLFITLGWTKLLSLQRAAHIIFLASLAINPQKIAVKCTVLNF